MLNPCVYSPLPQLGVYSKIPGDGREYLVTTPTATKIRAEDGRSITGVDISCFINNLPQGRDTKVFSSADASGSTSQAAAIMEYLELGRLGVGCGCGCGCGWWCGGVVVWWCGGVVVWWCGGVVVWWCGGVVVWWC